MFPLQTGLEGGQMPIGSLICNFPDPADGDGLALMEHSDVQTFFHEFGHLIHQLLARRGTWVTLAGINVEWDFVEAPSQILEEWAWDPGVLARFAKHVETDETIPAALVAKMRAADEFGKGVHVMRQIFYTAFSYFLHARDPKGLDLDDFTDEMYKKYNPYRRIESDHVYANFGHIIGYTSMYYTYQWSLVIAKDLFTRFKKAGMLDSPTATAYRKAILEPGGTVDAASLVEDFLGRPSNLDAYKDWLGN
jgi:thimet oligopeptidase